MNKPQDPEAAETVQTTNVPAVDLPRLVLLLPCPFCGTEAEITDESQPNRPKSWFFAWCKNRPECNAWLAASSPEKVAEKWNSRHITAMEEQLDQDLKLAAEVITELERDKKWLIDAGEKLVRLVEGPRHSEEEYRDRVGRLKDTGIWANFYTAVRGIQRKDTPKPSQQNA